VRTRKVRRRDQIQTRFPPEPNGYLHIGHAKAICIDFGLADEFGGKTNLRFDDTNPEKEETEYVNAIQKDIRWLGFDWDRLCYASDYFGQLYEWAIAAHQGMEKPTSTISPLTKFASTAARSPSPERTALIAIDQSKKISTCLRMNPASSPTGSRVLRAKIDMTSPNLNMRDPVMYRILHATHHRTGDEWCIYPMYDYAHGQSDSIEHVTHSMCSLEFADHQPLYRWFIEQLGIFPSQQIEFDRLSITYTLLSKRKLLQLVQEGRVNGWDDPRMPTLSGVRRRGFTPEAIRAFVASAGVSRTNGIVDIEMLEHFQRDDLNHRARARHGRAAPAQAGHRQLSRRQKRNSLRSPTIPKTLKPARARCPSRATLHRAGRLPRSASAEVLPPLARQGSAPAQCLLHHRAECRERCRRQRVEVHCTYDPA
jgi:glutaminyl-tRNA synthetase